MARTAGSDGGKTEAAIRAAAVGLIARHGYDAVSMRQLGEEVGVQAAALYRYFPTKEDLLFTLMREHMVDLIAAWEAARPATPEPAARLAAFVRNHIRFHVARRHSTHVSNLELRSLSPERLSAILRLRNSYERELRQVLREGAEASVFDIDDVGLTAMAIIQMITGVIVWFRPDERLSVEQVAGTYHAMTMRLVGAAGATARLNDTAYPSPQREAHMQPWVTPPASLREAPSPSRGGRAPTPATFEPSHGGASLAPSSPSTGEVARRAGGGEKQ